MKTLALLFLLALSSAAAFAAAKPEKQTITSRAQNALITRLSRKNSPRQRHCCCSCMVLAGTECHKSTNGKIWQKKKASFLWRLIQPTRASGA